MPLIPQRLMTDTHTSQAQDSQRAVSAHAPDLTVDALMQDNAQHTFIAVPQRAGFALRGEQGNAIRQLLKLHFNNLAKKFLSPENRFKMPQNKKSPVSKENTRTLPFSRLKMDDSKSEKRSLH